MSGIREGDMVEVIAGNDRGKRGKVLRVLPSRDRVVVQGVNLRWKHLRKSQQNPQGGRVRRELPVHRSNVQLFDEASGERTRIGWKVEGDRKVRIARRTGREIGAAQAGEGAKKKPAAGKGAKKKKAAPTGESKE